MEELALKFFPYPHVFRGERRDGSVLAWPTRCSNCDRQCQDAVAGELGLCSYGLNYERVDDDLLVAGLVVSDYPIDTKARRKMRSRNPDHLIPQEQLKSVIAKCGESTAEIERELRIRLDEIADEYRETKGYQEEILKALKPQLEQTLAQVHDYKQFVQQIVQNIDVLLERRYPGLPLEEKLDRAEHEEAAIYWAAIVMDEKLDAALFLESPARIFEKRELGKSRLHGLVLKYLRIYQSKADRKNLDIELVGESWGKVEGNMRALGIIPHTIIDNAIKYAPDGSRIELRFEEASESITLFVTSLGPRIRNDERTRIFDLFYRGNAARRKLKEGTGFGLASAQNIAKAHDTRIVVEQDDEPTPEGNYKTTFSVRLPRAKPPRTTSRPRSPRGSSSGGA